jgi:competence protein ComEA
VRPGRFGAPNARGLDTIILLEGDMKRLVLLLAMLLFSAFALAAVNINTATKEELDALPGIGPVKAQAIIDYRTKNGPFKTPEDIMKVPGIKEGEFGKLKGQISVSGASTPAAAAPAKAPETKSAAPAMAPAPAAKAPEAKTAAPAMAPAPAAAPAKADAKKDEKAMKADEKMAKKDDKAKAADDEKAKADEAAAKKKAKADEAAAKKKAKADEAAAKKKAKDDKAAADTAAKAADKAKK